MRQIIVGHNKAYAASTATYTDLTKLAEGTIGIYNLSDGSLVSKKSDLKSNFAVACGKGTNKMPYLIPEVDLKSLEVIKTKPVTGATFTGKITVPTPVVGQHYTVIVTKKGTVFNERSNWTFTSLASTTTAADVASDIVKQINANSYNLGVSASNTGGAITITASVLGTDYNIVGADALSGVDPTDVTAGKYAILDKTDAADLVQRCVSGKGMNYLADEGKEIYPGYPEYLDSNSYVLYTLRFAVPRVASKQRDEVVYQILYLLVPSAAAAVTTLDAIFDTADPTQSGS